jgi:hypothetical protein
MQGYMPMVASSFSEFLDRLLVGKGSDNWWYQYDRSKVADALQ